MPFNHNYRCTVIVYISDSYLLTISVHACENLATFYFSPKQNYVMLDLFQPSELTGGAIAL